MQNQRTEATDLYCQSTPRRALNGSPAEPLEKNVRITRLAAGLAFVLLVLNKPGSVYALDACEPLNQPLINISVTDDCTISDDSIVIPDDAGSFWLTLHSPPILCSGIADNVLLALDSTTDQPVPEATAKPLPKPAPVKPIVQIVPKRPVPKQPVSKPSRPASKANP
jgi:hypothetical protein